MLVNGDGTGEDQSLTAIVSQRHRVTDAKRAGALLLPHRLRTGHGRADAGCGHPAEFSIEGPWRARWREQHDRRRLRIGLLAILGERQVIDAATLKIDAAAEPRRLDRDPRRGGDKRLARSPLRLRRWRACF